MSGINQRLTVVVCSVTFVFALVLSRAVPLVAWGAQGHHVVARIAWALMTPAARDEATTLLGGGQAAFIASATWADDVRSSRPETSNWHFVDIPVGESHYDAARDCRPTEHGDCIIAEIARARVEVADRSRPVAARAESLKFLVHFVGDLHQPLHAVDNHDRGGNDVHVQALRGGEGRATNLHSVWDTGLINLTDTTEAARADALIADLRAHPMAIDVDVTKWAEESHDLAVRVAYHYPSFSPGGPPVDAVLLAMPYRTAALETIERQLAIGGARLAAMLNTLLPSR